jgi:hypothetical protein
MLQKKLTHPAKGKRFCTNKKLAHFTYGLSHESSKNSPTENIALFVSSGMPLPPFIGYRKVYAMRRIKK